MTTITKKDIVDQTITEAWINKQKNKQLLRFLTCGSVDDGKSTLIGRLLHDTKQVYEDQLVSLQSDSKRHGSQGERLDLAFLVDGLQAEREQGITIDVAYRYFSTDRRKFIIADTPGHEQYTRNMATGASTCDLAILLIDARKGVLNQTRRHSLISTLLGIKYLIVAINKMDLVDYSQDKFHEIQKDYLHFSTQLPHDIHIHCVPISALEGTNVAGPSGQIPWYTGSTLLEMLETIEINREIDTQSMRFPVQYVNRPSLDFRGYSGMLSSGKLRIGQLVTVLPSGIQSTVARITTFDGDLHHAVPGEAITVVLKDEIDVSRGDLLIDSKETLIPVRAVSIDVVWMSETPLITGNSYDIKLAHKTTSIRIINIEHQIDINNLTKHSSTELSLNAIGRIDIIFDELLPAEPYAKNKITGSMIIIDRINNATVGAGMIHKILSDPLTAKSTNQVSFEIELHALIRRYFPHWGVCTLNNR
ncbi:sulfate adenylyltransferase subunit CysN [Candidatus Erwinia haradaeae]|uniref:Sulfate adenylyltransferase subunit 1 n=1 Tax=Candidatus Erwinia haradaeae TaxID=1922217 RepID=A0A451DAK1_9GAMM|nr:sulfate adenylyltransferase subunit CysN [Candidatus Erwinia haradaeae]VFP83361.1 Sulfate adenylyltransferase subunit 1 [Candidatus Erwinia haradaeae]